MGFAVDSDEDREGKSDKTERDTERFRDRHSPSR